MIPLTRRSIPRTLRCISIGVPSQPRSESSARKQQPRLLRFTSDPVSFAPFGSTRRSAIPPQSSRGYRRWSLPFWQSSSTHASAASGHISAGHWSWVIFRHRPGIPSVLVRENFSASPCVSSCKHSLPKMEAPMEMLLQDLRYASRALLKAPGLSIVIIISIALGVAANATVFSIANGLLWGVLPIRDPGRVVMFSEGQSFSYPDFVDYNEQTRDIFDGGVAAHFPIIPASIGGKGEPERVWGQAVGGNLFSTLGNPIALGRPILPDDDRAAAGNHVVVLSDKLWRRRFAADPNILNREVALNGKPYTVVGVAPPAFYGMDRGIVSEFWIPLAL